MSEGGAGGGFLMSPKYALLSGDAQVPPYPSRGAVEAKVHRGCDGGIPGTSRNPLKARTRDPSEAYSFRPRPVPRQGGPRLASQPPPHPWGVYDDSNPKPDLLL